MVTAGGTLDGSAYERWVAGYDVETGAPRGRLRTGKRGLRFVEVVVNGPKTWSLAAALHPEVAAAYDAAQDKAAEEIIGWLAGHATTRVGPRGRQLQVPVERLEAAVVRHHTSRAGDPHRHLHLQINARVFAAGGWRGLHSVGVVHSIAAINGIGHAAVACDPEFRSALAKHGYTLDPETGEVAELAPYAGAFSARAMQIARNVDCYEAQWRGEHPGAEPGRALRRAWDRRAWAQARPDKVVPTDGTELSRQWVQELHDLGFTPPHPAADPTGDRPMDWPGDWRRVRPGNGSPRLGTPIGQVNRDAVADLVLCRLGTRRSSWNAADIRGEVERIVAAVGVIADAPVRHELVEDLTMRTLDQSVPLLTRDDVPEHVRSLTSREVLAVEADLTARLAVRAEKPAYPARVSTEVAGRQLDQIQRQVAAALAGTGDLMVVEGAAGSGKTTTLAAARDLLDQQGLRLVVVTPTLKAARVAGTQLGTDAFSAAWLVHQHGYRWDEDGRWSRIRLHPDARPDPRARLLPWDLLLVDEAGMLDQDTARALLTIADETGARVAFVGDRHQLPAVGRGGVLDYAARWARPEACLDLDTVHRFADPEYADLSLLMRTGEHGGEVFDALLRRGELMVHHSEVERIAALTSAEGLVIADTREQVSALSAAIRDHRHTTPLTTPLTSSRSTAPGMAGSLTTRAGEQIGIGDRVVTRRNDRDLGVANRDTWTVTHIETDGGLRVHGPVGERTLPSSYVSRHVELGYATTVYGAQGETVPTAHMLIGEATGAAAAYVGMTRGRNHNTAHLVAENVEDARGQWLEVFARDRADLGPGHAARAAKDDIERYGPNAPSHSATIQAAMLSAPTTRRRPEPGPIANPPPSRGIGY